MKANFLFILAIIVFVSCVSKSGPINNSDFESHLRLSDLQGKYQNKGDTGNTEYNIYLSKIIWPSDEGLDHEHITYIDVRQLNANTITVAAIRTDSVLKLGEFLLGKDFSFKKGRIILKRQGEISGLKIGEPVLGIYTGNISLGLDKEGQGKYRSIDTEVGMAYLVVPVSMKAQEDVRFERIKSN